MVILVTDLSTFDKNFKKMYTVKSAVGISGCSLKFSNNVRDYGALYKVTQVYHYDCRFKQYDQSNYNFILS